MVKPSRLHQRSVPMGQTSSQVDPITDSEPDEVAAHSGYPDSDLKKAKRKAKSKAKRRSKVSENSTDLDEESARVLLQLREDAENNARIAPPRDKNSSASAQPWTESYSTSNGVENEMAETRSKLNGIKKKKKKKKKRNRHDYEASQHDEDNSQVTKDNTTERPSKQAKSHNSISTSNDRLNLTQSSFSLDDIPTDDESIATYLQEYEKTFTNPTSPNLTPIGAVESESRMQQPAATTDREGPKSPIQSVYQLPWRSSNSSGRREQERSNRKTRSGTIPETSDGGQEQMNGPGQHAFAIDHEAFDEEFETQQYGSASLSDDPADYDFPIDPDLIQDSPILAPMGEDVMTSSDTDVCQQPSNEVQSKRVSSSSRKRKGEKNLRRVSPSDLPYTTLEDLGGSQQDLVLPGIENTLEDLPPNGDLSRVSSAESGRSTPPNTRRQREKTPPPLAKACKPRGNKTQQGGQKGKHYDPPLQQVAQKGGMFTESEVLKLDAFRDSYCQQNEMTQWRFNELIQSGVRNNREAANLWNEVHEVTPYRTRMSTMRFCRRRYHNFIARGTWTQSEDESLRQAVAEKGKSWKAVGEMIERFPEDCRDRYRNYHVNSEHRNREQWTEGEVKNLCSAVYECMRMMKQEQKRARQERFDGRDVPESEPESDEEIQEIKLINWQAVSDRMGPAGGGRSRLQCSFKWGKLKTADRDRYWKEVRAATRAKPPLQKNNSSKEKGQWRLRKALKNLRNMKPGDRYDFLQAFSTCGAVEEGNIPYRVLGNEAFRSRWTTSERKAAWHKFKGEVPGADKMDYRDVVNRLLTQLMANSADKLEERWDPKVHGDINVVRKRRRLTETEKKEREKLRRESRMNIKSLEFVHSTDDDENQVKPNENATDAEIMEGSVEETGVVAGSSAAATDDAREDSSAGNTDTEAHGSAGSEVEYSDDEGLFVDSNWNASDELASQLELLRNA
ncbi:RNA polymerase I enhancer binding protein [Lobaria immixta]|nr:RNA polymerase I enhancer binding protein [Lobaria immixta]